MGASIALDAGDPNSPCSQELRVKGMRTWTDKQVTVKEWVNAELEKTGFAKK